MLLMNNYVSDHAKKFIDNLNKTCNVDQKNLKLRKKIEKYKTQIEKEKETIIKKMVSSIENEVLHFDDNYLTLKADFLTDNRIGFNISIQTTPNNVILSNFGIVYKDHNHWEIIQDEGETVLTSESAIGNFAHIETLNFIALNLRLKKSIGFKHKDIHNLFIYTAEMQYYKSYLIRNLYFY